MNHLPTIPVVAQQPVTASTLVAPRGERAGADPGDAVAPIDTLRALERLVKEAIGTAPPTRLPAPSTAAEALAHGQARPRAAIRSDASSGTVSTEAAVTPPFLHNMAWHSLVGPQADCAAGRDGARRYAPGFSPILGFADLQRPDFAALESCCEPGEHFYCADWSGAAPAGWRIDHETTMFQMLWDAPPPEDEAPDALPLGAAHVPQMLALVALTHPGPFGPRTVELGDYFGVFEGERLVAMAGERMCAGGLREVSGVCTHPDFQGRGLARRLVSKLVRRELRRDEAPFLHVMRDNLGAQRVYARMGFRHARETVVRVLTRCT